MRPLADANDDCVCAGCEEQLGPDALDEDSLCAACAREAVPIEDVYDACPGPPTWRSQIIRGVLDPPEIARQLAREWRVRDGAVREALQADQLGGIAAAQARAVEMGVHMVLWWRRLRVPIRPAPHKPLGTAWDEVARAFRSSTFAEAKRHLVPGPPARETYKADLRRRLEEPPDPAPTPLEALVGAGEVFRRYRRYRRALRAAPSSDRKYYVAVRQYLRDHPGARLGEAYRAVAGRFGVSVERVRSAPSRVARGGLAGGGGAEGVSRGP